MREIKDLNKKDGFCRAPRVELILENSRLQETSFDQLLNSSKFGFDNEQNMSMVRSLAKRDEQQ